MKATASIGPRTNPAPRVLIVEDSDDILFILKTELEFFGYTVEVVKDGAKALDAALLFRPHVILSDIGLPGIDGIELLSRIRQTAELASVPVIALTGFDSEEKTNPTGMPGFDARVLKPVDGASLAKLIQDLVGGDLS
jgi:two-component system CheB/CheR fusion protein